MRLDHIAYRVKDRYKTAKFLENCLGYSIAVEFDLKFEDGSTTDCLGMNPPEERPVDVLEWDILLADAEDVNNVTEDSTFHSYHCPPEIFVSDGPKGSIVGDWVKERGGVGGIHHIAYQVEDVEKTMKDWTDKGYAEWYSEKPLVCEETKLVQVFSKPSELTGVVYELITRGKDSKGFCRTNVKALMESTKN
tara:strand:- start:499 stop:1074 length:576 start_codon:yes stop_codon:yes gene_type:complete